MSTPIRNVFGEPAVVLPVIHLRDEAQGASEALLAFQTGARGVFLIDHRGRSQLTVRALDVTYAHLVAEGFARPWLGVNLLGFEPSEAFGYLHESGAYEVCGVWCDGAPGRMRKEPGQHGVWAALWFGGVAFKYQRPTSDLDAEAQVSIRAGVDVLTTSGPATGVACDPEKVRRLRSLVGRDRAVGVASGVTVENARGLVEAGADALLVATGISKNGDFHHMDPGRLAELLGEVKGATRG